jgi:ATP synthase protein I
MNGQDQNNKNSWYINYSIYSLAGIQLATSVVVGLMLGGYIDKKVGTAPWLTVIGLILGSVGGFYNLVKLVNWHHNRKK